MEHVRDAERLDAVAKSGLVDSEREAVFDELTKAAAQLLDAPFAFMTAVDEVRSFWKSTYGIEDGTRANAVEDSFCQYVIESNENLIVDDARAHPVTSDNPSIESMGVRAWAGCPVRLDGQVLGTFCVVDQRERAWTDRDRSVLESFAEIAAREIELRTELRFAESEADRYEELLDTLRLSLMPPSLPEIEGLALAAWHHPAAESDMVLGDFYDVFPLGERRWGIVVGDVCGHGVEAAKLTALVRYSLRSAAVHHQNPADVMHEVDAAIRRDPASDRRFATVCYLDVQMGDLGEAVVIRLARAGHPLPAVISSDGSVRFLSDAGGPPLGILEEPGDYGVGEHELQPGEILVVYTDGVTECREASEDVMLGEDGWRDILAGVGSSPADVVERAPGRLLAFADAFVDDAVILAVGPPRN